MKRFKLLLVHVAFVALCNAQSNISGVVLSFENDQPVSDVQIFSENDQFLGKTGSNGAACCIRLFISCCAPITGKPGIS